MNVRTAVVKGGHRDLDQVQAYMPSNYQAVEVGETVIVVGYDHAGWTLDGYVIPRLASGLIYAEEVTA